MPARNAQQASCAVYRMANLTQAGRLPAEFRNRCAQNLRDAHLSHSRELNQRRCPMSRHEQPNFHHRREVGVAWECGRNVIARGGYRTQNQPLA